MSETSNQSHAVRTFQDVLEQHPDMHPGLRPIAEHWAAKEAAQAELPTQHMPAVDTLPHAPEKEFPTYQGDLRITQNTLPADHERQPVEPSGGLAEVAANLRERQQQADMTMDKKDLVAFRPEEEAEITTALAEGHYSAEELAAFIDECFALSESVQRQHSRLVGTEYRAPRRTYLELINTLNQANTKKLQGMYRDPELSASLRTMIESMEESEEITTAFDLLNKIHGHNDALDLVADTDTDQTLASLLRRDVAATALATPVLLGDTPMWPKSMDKETASDARRQWADRYLDVVLELPEALRADLLDAAYLRISQQGTKEVDPIKLYSLLVESAENVQHLGADRITELYDKAGIMNLDYYNKKQLALMSLLVSGDKEILQHLQNGDVTVVFMDAKGDYNGVFKAESEDLATKNNRTLFFEIDNEFDFHRYMLLLNNLGVAPSTIVFSNHGDIGLSGFGKDENRFTMTNEYLAEGEDWHKMGSLLEAKGVARAINEFTQPSRGIDDNPEAAGQIRILLSSCEQDTLTPVRRGETTAKRRLKESELEIEYESNAEALARLINNPFVQVIAGDATLSTSKTERGIIFQREVTGSDGTVKNERFNAAVIRADGQGHLSKKYAPEVFLRRLDITVDQHIDARLDPDGESTIYAARP